jgi:ATP-dependent exoDNAse (exonuclease V) alpha subunit
VLGSDELYREWGYTALSRHRTEARFYVSASREFLTRRLSRSSLATPSLACS